MLDEPQLALLERFGTLEHVEIGDVPYAVGEQSHDLIVLLDCEVQVIDAFGQPDELVVTTLGPHEFLGEIGLLSGQRACMTALVRAPGDVLRVAPEDLLAIMGQGPELSELFLRAFLVRHSEPTCQKALSGGAASPCSLVARPNRQATSHAAHAECSPAPTTARPSGTAEVKEPVSSRICEPRIWW